MQIQTSRKELEIFKSKFEPLEKDSKHLNADSNHSKGIRSIQMQIRTSRSRKEFEAFESKFEHVEKDSKLDSNHSKGIWRIRIQILTIRTKVEIFECKF